MSGIAIRVLLSAAGLIGGMALANLLTQGAGGLNVGDCFDPVRVAQIKDLPHHPCNEKHTAEVVLLTTHPAIKGAPYPSEDDIQIYGNNVCAPAVVSYVGPNARLERLNFGILYPQASNWNDGDRRVTCYALMLDMSPMTSSLKAGS